MKKPDPDQLLLKGVRVLEIGQGAALAYAAKLFADFGAEVIKIESNQGDPWRTMPPLLPASAGQTAESALFAWLNTNKRSVSVNFDSASDWNFVQKLAQASDIILDARALTQGLEIVEKPLWCEGNGQEQQKPPHEIIFTWFGESGPYKDYVANYATCRAMSGAVHGSGPISGPPHAPHELHTGIAAGLGAFSLGIAAWLGQHTGSRRYVLSIHEMAFSTVEMELGLVQDGRHAPRLGVNRFCTTHPASVLETADGWIGIFTNTLAQWQGLCLAINRPDMGADPRFFTGQSRMDHADEIDAVLVSSFIKHSTDYWFELLTAHKHPAVMVPTMQQLLQQSVHRERYAFVSVQHGEHTFEGPVLPQRLQAAGPLLGGRAPYLGEDNNYYRHHLSQLKQSPALATTSATTLLPLAGWRVIDLTMGWAGPHASRTLADLGAEVIKVESITYPDWWRGVNYNTEFYQKRLYEQSSHFNIMNRNKYGITLDLTQAAGKQILLDLVKEADAVIENYSAEVLLKLGLDYSVLCQVNPDLVMLSMPAFGLNNAWSNTRAYGGTLEQATGLPLYTGHAQEMPAMTSYAYGDPIGGLNAVAAMLLGLLQKQQNKGGIHINMSQVEGMLPLTAPFLIEQSLYGHVPERQGNKHPVYAPHNYYACQGDDAWILISVMDTAQWHALCFLMGREDWATSGLFDVPQMRQRFADQIDASIAKWVSAYTDDALLTLLQENKIVAGAVYSMPRLLNNPHLWERGFWQTHEREYKGSFISSSSPYRINNQPMPVWGVAPTLGQHSKEVLRRWLQLSEEELELLEQQLIIGTEARPKQQVQP